jgi:hypothetical protein
LRLDLRKPGLVDLRILELFIDFGKPKEMSYHARAGVTRAGASSQDKGPIAGLREQQLPTGLLKRAFS